MLPTPDEEFSNRSIDLMNFHNEYGKAMIMDNKGTLYASIVIAMETGKGMGVKLVESLEKYAREKGFKELAFSIPSSSMIKVLIKRTKAGQRYRHRQEWHDLLDEYFDVLYTELKLEKEKDDQVAKT